jgi:hypothetical protein
MASGFPKLPGFVPTYELVNFILFRNLIIKKYRILNNSKIEI